MTRKTTFGVTLTNWIWGLWFISSLGWAQAPSVAATFPQDEAENLDCHFALSATLRFPSEAEQLDPVTLTSQAVRLYPQGQPDSLQPTFLDYQAATQTLSLTCMQRLQPYRTYVFEVTDQLADSRGFAFLPYQLTFTTGGCRSQARDVLAELTPSARLDPDQVRTVMSRPVAEWVGDSLHLSWTTEQEFISAYFLVERAADSSDFRPVGKVMGAGASQSEQQYSWADTDLAPGPYRYRVLAVDQLGKITTSDTVSLFQNGVALQGRVVRVGTAVQLAFVQAHKTTMVALFYNRERQVVKRSAGFVPAGTHTQSISVEGLPPGDYVLVVQTPDQRKVEPLRVVAE
jgi:hypothetical protein